MVKNYHCRLAVFRLDCIRRPGAGNATAGQKRLQPFQSDAGRIYAGNESRPARQDGFAFTVDAGHYQLEMDFANFTYDDKIGRHNDKVLENQALST